MKPHIITINRQYGSGGREVGEKLAAELGYAYYDKELIRRAVEESNIGAEFFEKEGEGLRDPLSYLLSFGLGATGRDEDSLPLTDRVFLVQARVIKQIASEGNCVIIGHCADYILNDRDDVLNIYIHSDWDSRVARVMRRNDLTEAEAISRIKKTDRSRALFYQQYTENRWGDAANYDISLSSSRFGIEGTMKLIENVVEYAG